MIIKLNKVFILIKQLSQNQEFYIFMESLIVSEKHVRNLSYRGAIFLFQCHVKVKSYVEWSCGRRQNVFVWKNVLYHTFWDFKV